jgi:hypothetical protein
MTFTQENLEKALAHNRKLRSMIASVKDDRLLCCLVPQLESDLGTSDRAIERIRNYLGAIANG